MKLKVSEATVEQILADMSCWEDIDTAILMLPTEDGGVALASYDGNHGAEGHTLKQALINLHTPYVQRYGTSDSDNLDWSEVLGRD